MLEKELSAIFIGCVIILLVLVFSFIGNIVGIVLLIKGLLALNKPTEEKKKKLVWVGPLVIAISVIVSIFTIWLCTIDEFTQWGYNLLLEFAP